MRAVAFRTPGLIPIEAFTTTGVNVKIVDNPIGFFGTGLKYVVAVLARHGIRLRVFIGGVEYEFYSKPKKFRGVEFQWIMMKKRRSVTGRWGARELSYTTEYGKNWELWQVLRELESNTRDERGASEHWQFATELVRCADDESVIVVESDEFAEVYNTQLRQVFLDETRDLRSEGPLLRIYNRPSKHLYYRGLRVYDLEIPSKYTYNIISKHELTEDRTLKYVYSARSVIARHLVTSTDRELIREIATAGPNHFEDKIDFDFVYETPSKEFMDVIRELKYTRANFGRGFSTYFGRYDTQESARDRRARLPIVDQWQEWLRISNPFDEELEDLVRRTISEIKRLSARVEELERRQELQLAPDLD
jgi:hypothetical protein